MTPDIFGKAIRFMSEPSRAMAVFTAMLVFIGIGALWIQRDTEKQQLRAYVSIELLEFRFLSPEYSPGVTMRLVNHGSTPAHKITHEAVIAVLPNPLQKSFEFPYPAENEDVAPFVLYPRQPRDSTKNRPTVITHDEIAKLSDGNNFRLYVYGVVRYVDIFEIPHSVKYCIFVDGDKFIKARQEFATSGIGGTARWFYAESYNEAD